MYPSSQPSNGMIKVAGIVKKEDCRAYKVFAGWIRELARRTGIDEDDMFKCEPVDMKDGVKGAKVFSCSLCKNTKRHSPEYNLFDGMRANGSVQDIGIGSPPPKVLSTLTVGQRMRLAMLKMHDAAFKAYGGSGYGHYTGGGALTPQDFSGLMGLAVVNDVDTLTAADVQKLDAALAHLRTTHSEIHKLLCVMERAERDPASFCAASGGAAAMPAMPADRTTRPEADGLPNDGTSEEDDIKTLQ
jgi:hypothetical protein